MEEDRFRNKTV